MFQPAQKVIEIGSGDGSKRPVGGEELGQQAGIGEEGFDSIGGTALVVEEHFPGFERRGQAGLGGQMGFGHGNLLLQEPLQVGMLQV